MSNIARINDWLWVGNHESCPQFPGELVVHIFRTDHLDRHPSQERSCTYDGRDNLRVNYRDGDLIDPANLSNLQVVAAGLKRQRRRTLVHCHAGMCRSPTLAIFLLAFAEGMHPYDAHYLVTKAIYDGRPGEVCNVVYQPFRQIVRLWEAARI